MKSALLTQLALCACPPLVAATTVTVVPQVRHAVHHATAPAHHRGIASSGNRQPYNCAPVRQIEVRTGVDRAFIHDLANFENGQSEPEPFGQGIDPALPERASATRVNASDRAEWASPILPDRPGAGPIPAPPTQPGSPTNPGGPGGTGPAGGSVPEPASWALMLVGFGSIGAAIRSGRRNKMIGIAGTATGGVTGLVATVEAGSGAVLASTRLATFGARAVRAAAVKKLGVCVCSAAAFAAAATTVPPLRQTLYAATMPAAERPTLHAACVSTAASAGSASQDDG